MFNLHILDVSALLHFGMNSARYKDRNSCGYFVGGIHSVMKQMTIALASYDSVILAFDGANNFRKQLMPEYKAGRIANKSVISQAELLLDYLPSTGIPCYKYDGYEGDDIINWCTSISSKYERVYIHGNDQDLIHNVRDNIIFHSINKDVNSVTASNFSYAVKKGEFMMFNFMSINKVLLGCKSDKVPAFVSENGQKGNDIYEWYLKALEFKGVPFIYTNTTNPDLFMKFMQYLPGVTQNDLDELQRRVKIIFPAKPVDGFAPKAVDKDQINKNALTHFLSLVNDFESLRSLNLFKVDLTQEERDFLRNRQQSLNNGSFAVDRNLPVHDTIDDTILSLKEF